MHFYLCFVLLLLLFYQSGLQNVYELVSKGKSELRIDLEAADGTKAYETFQDFSLSPGPDYTLHISKGTGTTGL